MGKRLVDKNGDRILVVEGARKARNRNYNGKFPIRRRTFKKCEEEVQRMYSPQRGMYGGWGG